MSIAPINFKIYTCMVLPQMHQTRLLKYLKHLCYTDGQLTTPDHEHVCFHLSLWLVATIIV